jgi:hypothetical protein
MGKGIARGRRERRYAAGRQTGSNITGLEQDEFRRVVKLFEVTFVFHVQDIFKCIAGGTRRDTAVVLRWSNVTKK